ncbi:hypothetical protein GBO74_06970 [Pediococcus acidilactici]|nr:hypothetical protein GBO53_08605 [Pediococcus acidilactici]KAF0409265.1 hypothetical protein GBO74_06970 [Pediococcus acidilactici]
MGEIHLNCIVRCRCSTDLKQPFVGKVIKMDDDEAVVTILEYDSCERYVAYEITSLFNILSGLLLLRVVTNQLTVTYQLLLPSRKHVPPKI